MSPALLTITSVFVFFNLLWTSAHITIHTIYHPIWDRSNPSCRHLWQGVTAGQAVGLQLPRSLASAAATDARLPERVSSLPTFLEEKTQAFLPALPMANPVTSGESLILWRLPPHMKWSMASFHPLWLPGATTRVLGHFCTWWGSHLAEVLP